MSNKNKKYARLLGIYLTVILFSVACPAFAETITWSSSTNDFDNLGVTSIKQAAEPFTPSANSSAAVVQAALSTGASNPGDDLVVSIETDNSNSPSGTVLGTATLVNGSIQASPCSTGVLTFPTVSGLSLTAGTKYWAVFSRSGSIGTPAFYMCFTDNVSGLLQYLNGSNVWTTYGADLWGNVVLTAGGGGGGGGVASSTLPFPGYEASTTFQVIDNPNQDIANSIYLFIAGLWTMLLLFNRSKKI